MIYEILLLEVACQQLVPSSACHSCIHLGPEEWAEGHMGRDSFQRIHMCYCPLSPLYLAAKTPIYSPLLDQRQVWVEEQSSKSARGASPTPNAEGQTPLSPLGDAFFFPYSTIGATKVLLGKTPWRFHRNGVHMLMMVLVKAKVTMMHLYL